MSQSLSTFRSIPRQTTVYLIVVLLWTFRANANLVLSSELQVRGGSPSNQVQVSRTPSSRTPSSPVSSNQVESASDESRQVERESDLIQEITIEQAIVLVRKQSPALLAARHRQYEAKRQWKTASIPPFNPQLSGAIGPRFTPRTRSAMSMHGSSDPSDDRSNNRSIERTIDGSVGVRQWIETGGQGALRRKVAKAGVDVEMERIKDVERQLVRDLSFAFITSLYWQRRLFFAEENIRMDLSTATIATRRHEIGDGGGLDVSVAALALARSRNERAQIQAELLQVMGEIKAILGFPAASKLRCRGDLRKFSIRDEFRDNIPKEVSTDDFEVADVEELRHSRPDLRARRAQIRQVEAQAKLGRAHRAPNLALGAMYAREESANIVQGTLRIALPVLDHGQGKVAVAQARSQRLRAESDALERNIFVESHTARAVVQRYEQAVREFEASGLEFLERAERSGSISYREGAIPLAELLALRRELVQAKLSYSDLLLGAAKARVQYQASMGGLR